MDFLRFSAAIWVSTARHPAFPDGCLPGSNARESTMTDPTTLSGSFVRWKGIDLATFLVDCLAIRETELRSIYGTML